MDVLDTLNTQHRLLERTAQEIVAALKGGAGEEIRAGVDRFSAILEAHLTLEEAHFYPQLRARARQSGSDTRLQVVELFSNNMKVIANGLRAFFARYQGTGPLDVAAFGRDFKSSMGVLLQRMAAEEQTLHPLFEELRRG